MTPAETEEFRQQLTALRDQLNQAEETGAAAEEPVELDQTRMGRLSRMDAMQQQAMSQETGRQRRVALSAIDQALERINDGSFGECDECAEDIAPARLRANPAVTLCIHCASSLESS